MTMTYVDDTVQLFIEGESIEFTRSRADYGSADDAHAQGALTAPMPGKVSICVEMYSYHYVDMV